MQMEGFKKFIDIWSQRLFFFIMTHKSDTARELSKLRKINIDESCLVKKQEIQFFEFQKAIKISAWWVFYAETKQRRILG